MKFGNIENLMFESPKCIPIENDPLPIQGNEMKSKVNLGKIMLYGKRIFPVYNALVLTLLFLGMKPEGSVLVGIGIVLCIMLFLDLKWILGQEHDEIINKTGGFIKMLENQEMIKAELGIEDDVMTEEMIGKARSLARPLLASKRNIEENPDEG